MFSFLTPIFLWAAAAAAVPLILHLMQRSRTVRVPFSTVRFLKMAQKRSSNRIRMENFLLWLIRTLLMLALAAAFAMPMLRTQAFGSFLSRSERDVAIVIDSSYSMTYQTGKETVWEKTIQCAVSIVESLEHGDRVCVFMAGDAVQPVIEQLSGEREMVISQIRTLEPTKTSSQLCPATLAAYDALQQEGRRREREIHILSDGQSLPWSGFVQTDTNAVKLMTDSVATNKAPGAPDAAIDSVPRSTRLDQWQPEKIDKKTAFFISLLGATTPENVTPISLQLQPALILPDVGPRIQVRLSRTGPPQSTTVTVFVDDEEVGNRSAALGEAESEEIAFSLPPNPAGMHTARVQTLSDNLPIDNELFFLIKVREALPTLCIGTVDDTFYLLKALNAGLAQDSEMRIKRIGIEEVAAEDLFAYSCIFACNVLPLQAQADVLKLEGYVKNGGLLVLYPGDRGALGDYQVMNSLPATPTGIRELSQSVRRKMLRWEQPQHPILRTLKLGPGGAPVVTINRTLVFDKLNADSSAIVVMGDKEPFLLSRDYGRGRVLLFSVPADRSWSTFPLSPFYLPISHQVVQYGAGISSMAPYLSTTRSLPLTDHIPTAAQGTTMQDPDGKPVPIRSSVVEGRTLLRAEDVLTPGIYKVSKPNSPELEPALALNLDRTESDLTPVKREEIPKMIGVSMVNVAGDRDELMRLIQDFRVGRTLGEVLLWIVLVLAVIEIFYANFKSKAPPSLADALGVEASGKVTGGSAPASGEGEAP